MDYNASSLIQVSIISFSEGMLSGFLNIDFTSFSESLFLSIYFMTIVIGSCFHYVVEMAMWLYGKTIDFYTFILKSSEISN